MVDIHTRDVIKQVYDKGYFLELTEEAKDVIAKAGYQPEYGARPLKRAVDALVGKPLSDLFPINQFSDGQKLEVGDTIRVEAREGVLVFVKGEPGKFQPPQLILSAPIEEVWQKLNSRIDEGRDFALEELYPLMSRLPKPEEQKEARPAPEAPPAPVPMDVKPEPPVAVEPPPAEPAPVEPPRSMKTADVFTELYLRRRRSQRPAGPPTPPPAPSRPVGAKSTLWGQNQERLGKKFVSGCGRSAKKIFRKELLTEGI